MLMLGSYLGGGFGGFTVGLVGDHGCKGGAALLQPHIVRLSAALPEHLHTPPCFSQLLSQRSALSHPTSKPVPHGWPHASQQYMAILPQ